MPAASPEVFTRPPRKHGAAKPGQLPQQQVDRFFQEGFLVVPDFFGSGVLQPVIDSIDKLVDVLAEKLFNAGKIQDKHEDATFYKRLTLIENEFPGAAVLLHKVGIMPKAFRELWSNEKLLNVVEQFIGPDVAGHPIWNLRTKTPHNTQATVPWHQDNVRWSVDLRWQRPDQPNGFFGLKENVLLRSSKDPDHVIDWEKFAVDRHKLEDTFTRENTKSEDLKDAKVDDPVVGRWMSRWKIVHHNRHTAAFMKTGSDVRTWQKP